MSVKISVEGVDALARDLRRFGADGKRAAMVGTRATTQAVLRTARSNLQSLTSPAASGVGASSLMTRYNEDKVRGFVTHPRTTFYLRFFEFGTKKQDRKPWLFPAAESERRNHESRTREALRRIIERAGR